MTWLTIKGKADVEHRPARKGIAAGGHVDLTLQAHAEAEPFVREVAELAAALVEERLAQTFAGIRQAYEAGPHPQAVRESLARLQFPERPHAETEAEKAARQALHPQLEAARIALLKQVAEDRQVVLADILTRLSPRDLAALAALTLLENELAAGHVRSRFGQL